MIDKEIYKIKFSGAPLDRNCFVKERNVLQNDELVSKIQNIRGKT